MSPYPTERWLEAYGRALDESQALDALASGWGVGFDGDVLLVIEGNKSRLLRYGSVLQLLGDLAAAVGTIHLFPRETAHPGGMVLDEAVRQPVIFGRLAQRQANIVTSAFSPF